MLDKSDNVPMNDKKIRAISYNEKQTMGSKRNMSMENTAIYANKSYIR
jgi:hypothetical protein